MRLLFTIDTNDYQHCTSVFVRNSARSIIIREGKIAMVHSVKYHYYKFPGGGIEPEENGIDAVIRETLEETGLVVLPNSVIPFGYVHREQKSTENPMERFVQDNFYYLCSAQEVVSQQHLDNYEREENFQLQWVDPHMAIDVNRYAHHGSIDFPMLERECKVLEILIAEKYFS